MSDIHAQLTSLGIDRERLKTAVDNNNWGCLVHAFEILSVCGIVLEAWSEDDPETPVCQFIDPSVADAFPCEYRESGGFRCERLDPHGDDGHWWSSHTIRHSIAGNGYGCSSFTEDPESDPATPHVFEPMPGQTICVICEGFEHDTVHVPETDPDSWAWVCARCGQAPEQHADPSSTCIYAPVLRKV